MTREVITIITVGLFWIGSGLFVASKTGDVVLGFIVAECVGIYVLMGMYPWKKE